jgi:hypothetical protein
VRAGSGVDRRARHGAVWSNPVARAAADLAAAVAATVVAGAAAGDPSAGAAWEIYGLYPEVGDGAGDALPDTWVGVAAPPAGEPMMHGGVEGQLELQQRLAVWGESRGGRRGEGAGAEEGQGRGYEARRSSCPWRRRLLLLPFLLLVVVISILSIAAGVRMETHGRCHGAGGRRPGKMRPRRGALAAGRGGGRRRPSAGNGRSGAKTWRCGRAGKGRRRRRAEEVGARSDAPCCWHSRRRRARTRGRA